jgi:hypothetical protein
MTSRLFVAFAALAATISLARAAEPETLTVLRECPSKGWHRACLSIPFSVDDSEAHRLYVTEIDKGTFYPDKWLDHVRVEGTLLEASGRGAFRLKLPDYQVSDNESESPYQMGAFAFVGRSRSGNPIVLTDRGPLEIKTKSITFSESGELFVVNAKTGKLLKQMMRGIGTSYVVTAGGEIGAWDATRAICISSPTQHSRDLAIITTACKKAGLPQNGVVGGNAVQTADYDTGLVTGIAFDPTDKEVYRIPGTDIMLIWAVWEYCC